MRKRIVEQLEKEKLIEILLEKIYYKNTVVNKIETGRSGFNPSFKKIDLVYRTTFYFERNEIYSEIQNRQYDEWDFITLKNCSPVLTDEIIKPTEYQIKQILLKLPEDKLINIILAAKSIQDYRKYQLSERIIAYLEHYNLTSILLNHIYYFLTCERKMNLGKSKIAEEWTGQQIVELTYAKHYRLIDNKNSKEDLNCIEEKITYDEGNYPNKKGRHPLNLDELYPVTKEELYTLIKTMTYDKLELLIKRIEEIVQNINSQRENHYIEQIPKLTLK